MLKKLNNMQIRERLVKAFIFIAGSLAVIAAVGLITMIVVSNLYADALTNYGFAQGDVGQAMASFADARSAMRGVIGYEEQSSIDSMMEEHSKYTPLYNFSIKNVIQDFLMYNKFANKKIRKKVILYDKLIIQRKNYNW